MLNKIAGVNYFKLSYQRSFLLVKRIFELFYLLFRPHTCFTSMSPASEQIDIIRKEDSPAKDVTSNDQHSQETSNQGIEAVVDRLRRKRQLIVNIVMAILVAGFGSYVKI